MCPGSQRLIAPSKLQRLVDMPCQASDCTLRSLTCCHRYQEDCDGSMSGDCRLQLEESWTRYAKQTPQVRRNNGFLTVLKQPLSWARTHMLAFEFCLIGTGKIKLQMGGTCQLGLTLHTKPSKAGHHIVTKEVLARTVQRRSFVTPWYPTSIDSVCTLQSWASKRYLLCSILS